MTSNTIKKTLLLPLLVCSSMAKQALAGDFDFGIYLAQETVQKEVALEQGIGEAMQSGGATLSYTSDIEDSLALENNPYDEYQSSSSSFSIVLGAGLINAPDNKKFTVATVDSNDDEGTRSSNVSGTTLFGELGYNYSLSSKFSLFFNLGRASYGLNRSISACSNCPEESVSINASNYGHVGMSYGQSPKFKLGYQHHNDGDMINSLRLQLAW